MLTKSNAAVQCLLVLQVTLTKSEKTQGEKLLISSENQNKKLNS